MSSREDILSRIKQNKPEGIKEPILDKELFNENIELLDQFCMMIKNVGGQLIPSNVTLLEELVKVFPEAKLNYSTLPESANFNTVDLEQLKTPHELEPLDVLVLEGSFGIAENGAIWVSEQELPLRVMPFITKHLVLVLDQTKIFLNMHEAYEQLDNENFDFGVFISGPSKTADIEQSLVIGAQGALSLSVFLK